MIPRPLPYSMHITARRYSKNVFQPTDSCPIWMSPEEQEKRRYDVILEGQFITRK
jgi:hypothetical protein